MQNLSSNMRGGLFMVLSMAGFVFNDTLMKFVLGDLPFFEALAIRGAFATLLVGLLCWRMGGFVVEGGILAALSHPAVLLRTIGEVGATIFFLTALTHMQIATVTAVLQILPLTIVLGAAWILGENVGWRRYLAIAVGFFGVMLILKPGTEAFDAYSLYALVAVFFVTLRDLATRRMPKTTPSLLISVVTAAVIMAMGCAVMPFQGVVAPTGGQVLLLASAAAVLMFGYIFSIMSMRVGEVGFVTPFRYSILIFALILGYAVFGDVPDGLAMLGAAIVVGSGLFTFYRERLLSRKAEMSAELAAASSRNHP